MTPIATQRLDGKDQLFWEPIPGARMSIRDARKAYDAGKIIMVTGRTGDVRTLYVKDRKAPPKHHHPYFAKETWREMHYGGPSRGYTSNGKGPR